MNNPINSEPNKKEAKRFDSPVYTGYLDEKGICHMIYKPDVVITMEMMKESLDITEKFLEGERKLIILDMTPRKTTDKDIRNYTAVRAKNLVEAMALVSNSFMSKFIGNLFMSLNKPKFPVQMFTNENNASRWIEKYL